MSPVYTPFAKGGNHTAIKVPLFEKEGSGEIFE
jgi:hypothetical protein